LSRVASRKNKEREREMALFGDGIANGRIL
jgi:hypothetical protein